MTDEETTSDRLVKFVDESSQQRGFPPTMREIQAALGLASVSSVQHHITILRREGRITTVPGGKRTIRVVK